MGHIANITFVDLGDSNNATIEFGNYSSSSDGSEAFTFLPVPPGLTGASNSDGDVFVNTHYAGTSTAADAPLGYVYMTLIHETGHALGLEHPSNYNAGSGNFTYANNASYIQDDHQYTVMSYFSETNTGGNYIVNSAEQYPETPMLDDVAAIQRLYGANMTTATGNTTYGFNSTLANTVYSITSASQVVVFNVWDAGGTDTFDFSGYSQNQTINLNAESFSSVGGLTSNVSISLGVTIENAIGGSGNDIIIGNNADNNLKGGPGDDTITGGGGNDTIDGGTGSNTAVYSAAQSAYSVINVGNGTYQVSGPDGIDTLANIQYLKFGTDSAVTITAAADTPSTVAVTGPIVLSPSQWLDFNILNLPITVTDDDGDPIVTYRFTDAGNGLTSADLWFSGLAANNGYVAQGGTVDVPADQLSGFWIQGGSIKGTDTLQVQVFDGYLWSATQNITVTTNTPPVVTSNTTVFDVNQTVALSSIFTATDADNDAITQYQVSDITAGGAFLELKVGNNYVQQAENTVFTINAADLGQWYITTSPVNHSANQFQVSAFDDTSWSTTASISVISGDAAPVATVTGQLFLKADQWLNLDGSTLPVSTFDADGDAIVSYRFTDVSAGATSDYLWFNSNVAQGGAVTVPAAQLSNFWIHAGSVSGTDTLLVEVYDGYKWSAPQSITITARAGNHAPAVVAGTTSFDLNQTVAASTIIGTADADSDTIQQYKVTETVANGTQLLLANVAQPLNTTVIVPDLTQLQVVTSSVNHSMATFSVQIFDGFDWSAATTINVTSVALDTASVVSVNGGITVAPNSWFNVTSLPITVSDVDGDAIVSYRFIDVSAGASSDYLWFNNNIAQGGSVDVLAAQLSNFWIHGATTNGTDTLQVEVFDGSKWSTPQTITVTTHGVNHAPVVSALATSFGLGQHVGAASVFTATDADGDPILQYKVTDITVDGAYLALKDANGIFQPQPDNTPIVVTDLSQVEIVTSSINRTMNSFTVQAYDGYNWSAVTTIDVSSMTADNPSAVTVNGSLTVAPSSWLNVTSLPIAVSDADGDPIVSYRFTDLSAAVGSDYLWFNNVVAQGGTVEVAAAQLANFWIHGATTNGIESLQVQVYDGYQWSDPQTISVITHGAEHPAVVSAATTSLGFDQTVGLSSIFTATDPDSDAITQIQVSDATVGGAHLAFDVNNDGNYVQQAESTIFTINSADLSRWEVVTSSVAHDVNTFQIAAFDGIGWSNPATINVVSGDTPSVETVTGALQLAPTHWINFNTANLPISVADADGDAVVTYRFTDVGAGSTSAHLWFNNNIVQGGSVDVPSDQLSNLWLQADSGTGIDTLRVQVNDGFTWSAPQDISVITSPQPVNSNPGAHLVTGGTTGGNDVLTGTAASDTFVFAPSFGNDTINSYTPGQDVLAIDHTVFATSDAALANTHDVAGSAVIQVDASNSITITGVLTATLIQHQSDLHIV